MARALSKYEQAWRDRRSTDAGTGEVSEQPQPASKPKAAAKAKADKPAETVPAEATVPAAAQAQPAAIPATPTPASAPAGKK